MRTEKKMTSLLNTTRKTLGKTRESISSGLERGYYFPTAKLGQGFSPQSASILGLFWVLTFALTANYLALNPASNLQSLVPSGAWALVGCVNLGFLRELAFKVIVVGGLIAQNRSRLVMLLALAIVLVFKLVRRAAAATRPNGTAGEAAAVQAKLHFEPRSEQPAEGPGAALFYPSGWRMTLAPAAV
jgi:hypothetical protein